MKAGLKFADRVTTVSPTYAREIATHEFGCGLDGVIRGRGADVSGILNGIDDAVSGTRPPTPRSPRATMRERLAGKRAAARRCRPSWASSADDRRLARRRGQPADGAEGPGPGARGAAGAAARTACSSRCRAPASRRWRRRSGWPQQAHPGRVAVHIGYDEALRAPPDRRRRRDRRALALRALRPDPAVRPALRHAAAGAARRRPGRHGGRREPEAIASGDATGFLFDAATPAAFERCVRRAIDVRANPGQWASIRTTAMARELSWAGPARDYMALYAGLLARHAAGDPGRAA